MKKSLAIILIGVGLAGCQSTSRGFNAQDRYDSNYIKPARNITAEHTDLKGYKPFISSPVCHKQTVYHPGRKPEVYYRCFN